MVVIVWFEGIEGKKEKKSIIIIHDFLKNISDGQFWQEKFWSMYTGETKSQLRYMLCKSGKSSANSKNYATWTFSLCILLLPSASLSVKKKKNPSREEGNVTRKTLKCCVAWIYGAVNIVTSRLPVCFQLCFAGVISITEPPWVTSLLKSQEVSDADWQGIWWGEKKTQPELVFWKAAY